ncbi:MAG: D-sedoheptulose 7-phosphate isomerase [Rhodospirillales bacterium]|nr:D-sedoheptulose 7-phosphate isomerase [Rhodospirillales bacterium]
MDVNEFFDAEFDEHAAVMKTTRDALREPFTQMLAHCVESTRRGGKIVFFGNGGSASDSQHLATELSIRYIKDRAPIAAMALTTDTSALTAAGNDMGFDRVFSRQVEALCKPEDTVIGISTSGNSINVLKGLEAARAMGCATIALGGKDGGTLKASADVCLIVPSQTTSRIQEMHIILGHMLCGALETELGLV